MRWICLSLLLLNFVLAAWQIAVHQGWKRASGAVPPALVYRPSANAASVKLLSEAAASATTPGDPASTPPNHSASAGSERPVATASALPTTAASVTGGRQLCLMLGPYQKASQAAAAVSRMAAAEIPASIKEIEVPLTTNFLVYLPPLPSREAAETRLNQLKLAGYDSYIIPKGELRNGIALGSFDSAATAAQLYESLQKNGLEAKIRDGQQMQQKEIWVAVAPGNEAKLGAELKRSLLKLSKSSAERQILCSAIAPL